MISPFARHAFHECWWSRNRLCELRWEREVLSGSGIDGIVLEAACANAQAGLILEPESEDRIGLRIVLPGFETISGSLLQDCFFELRRPSGEVGREMIRAVLEHLLFRHTGLIADLTTAAPELASALDDQGPLRFRADPLQLEIGIEGQQRSWPLGAKRFCSWGRIRFPDGMPSVEWTTTRQRNASRARTDANAAMRQNQTMASAK